MEDDFEELYRNISNKGLELVYTCKDDIVTNIEDMIADRRNYFCCAKKDDKCIIHQCIPVLFNTSLDKKFRRDEKKLPPLFMIDGRFIGFPNLMMNNNILMHTLTSKGVTKKRLFLYGTISKGLQIVYEDNKLNIRDSFGKDYSETKEIEEVIKSYLVNNPKRKKFKFLWPDNFLHLLKVVMGTKQGHNIDALSNKVIYKPAYLIWSLLSNILTAIDESPDEPKKNIFKKESERIASIISGGKLLRAISKTQTSGKRLKNNSTTPESNYNVEVSKSPLYGISGNDVARVMNNNMTPEGLMHQEDYTGFIDSFVHSEMTSAGHRFLLCDDVVLPDFDQGIVVVSLLELIEMGVLKLQGKILLAFNTLPTKYFLEDPAYLIDFIKRRGISAEFRSIGNILFLNYHEGLIFKRRYLSDGSRILVSPNENISGIIQNLKAELSIESLMSKTTKYYFKDYTHIFNVIPLPKIFVAMSNMKNAILVSTREEETNHVLVDEKIYKNDRMVNLWTIVGDFKSGTAEDPYIPLRSIPMSVCTNHTVKIKGGVGKKARVVFHNSENFIEAGANVFIFLGTVISTHGIEWGNGIRRFQVTYCQSDTRHIYKVGIYIRRGKKWSIGNIKTSLIHREKNINLIFSCNTYSGDLEGMKICSIHGQKGVLAEMIPLELVSERGNHIDVMLSMISFKARQSNFEGLERDEIIIGGKKNFIFKIPYFIFNNTPSQVFKELISPSKTGLEKIEGARLDQFSQVNNFQSKQLSGVFQYLRGGSLTSIVSENYQQYTSLLKAHNYRIEEINE